MLIWICALHCEARPIIDHYRLKRSHDDSAFELYRGDGMQCVISGMGKTASAAATAWIAGRSETAASIAWINLGIAGAAEHEIGSAFLLDKIIDGDSGQRYYPVLIERALLPAAACISLGLPSNEYQQEYLFDMEASGFAGSALRFSSAELIQSIKLVSDNRAGQIDDKPQAVSDLIRQRMPVITRQAEQLIALNAEIGRLEIDPGLWRLLTAKWRFSQTQQNRLRILLRYLLQRQHDSGQLMRQLDGFTSSKAVISALEQMSHRDSDGL